MAKESKTLNLDDLADAVQLKSERALTKALIKDILKEAFDAIDDASAAGDQVRIHNFGTFSRKDRPERKGRNPQTGEAITIAASSALSFKPTKHAK